MLRNEKVRWILRLPTESTKEADVRGSHLGWGGVQEERRGKGQTSLEGSRHRCKQGNLQEKGAKGGELKGGRKENRGE